MKVGTRVIRNPQSWLPNDFDLWGRGKGIGTVVEPPFEMNEGSVDIRWPDGRCFETEDQIIAEIDGKFKICISLEEMMNLARMEPLESDAHLEMYYGWKIEDFEDVSLFHEPTLKPTLILTLK
jgi:hypothetical protein